MAGTLLAARVALAMCLAVFAASFPPLRAAVLDWMVAADRLPETALSGDVMGTGQMPGGPVG